ncbi:MAG: DUF4276 family protein [Oligosphaeraceae bacterium]|nr:DUF4276 family protein [Oligosphaeraceae bacterium]
MMKKIIFLLEEASMKACLDEYLPRLLPGLDFQCIKHEGKQDLEKSIPRKLRAWSGVDFVVVRDNDGADCMNLKARLLDLCRQGGREDALVRIACQELESWFLGAADTLAEAYDHPGLRAIQGKAKYRDPDRLGNPSREMARLLPTFQKIDCSRRMGQRLPTNSAVNASHSFRVFVQGVCRLAGGNDS